MKSVLINLKDGENNYTQELSINDIIKLDTSFVDPDNHLNKDELGVLIQLQHQLLTSILNLTYLTPYVLLFFDADLVFKGASYSIKSSPGSFSIQTQYKNILFLKIPHSLKLHQIINLNF